MINKSGIVIERLVKSHDCSSFFCGSDDLDEYLKKYARQNNRSGIGRTYVAREGGSKKIIGYYTVSSASVEGKNLPERYSKKLPGYPVPCALLGRLAVNEDHQKQGLGEYLLMDALFRILTVSEEIGVYAVIVRAENMKSVSFYKKYGFEAFIDSADHLVLSMKAISKAFNP